MLNGHYTKVAFTPDEVQARAADLLARSKVLHQGVGPEPYASRARLKLGPT